MTAPQLKAMLRWAIRYIGKQNTLLRLSYTGRIDSPAVRLKVAKTEIWLSKARKAVARPKAVRKGK